MSDTPLRTILLTGFLGAGKTTFLNAMLAYLRTKDMRVCLIINEFGRIGIDGGLVTPGPEVMREINAGSIFCVCTRDQFLNALVDAASAEVPFDVMVMEATGLANTADLGSYIAGPPVDGRVQVVRNFCLVDAAHFHKVRKTLPAAVCQVQEASVLIVNKTDLVSSEDLEKLHEELRALNAHAPIVYAQYGAVDFEKLLSEEAMSEAWNSHAAMAATPPAGMVSASLETPQLLNEREFRAFLSTLPETLLRGKGTVCFGERAVFLEWIVDGWHEREVPARVISADMKDAEEARSSKKSCLVLIGPDLDESLLQARFSACGVG